MRHKRRPSKRKKSRYHQGSYSPENPEKYVGDTKKIFYRSSWEFRYMLYCDRNPTIIKWNSENVIVPYVSPKDGRIHRYFVDFWIQFKNKEGGVSMSLIEIKPRAQTKMPRKKKDQVRYLKEVETYAVNQAKWDAAILFAEKRNATFVVLTEVELKPLLTGIIT